MAAVSQAAENQSLSPRTGVNPLEEFVGATSIKYGTIAKQQKTSLIPIREDKKGNGSYER